MIRIAQPCDWGKITDPRLREWLRAAHPFIDEQEPDGSEWGPANTGWLLVLDESDNIRRLNTGVPAIQDLTEVTAWEWAEYTDESADDVYTAVRILGDSFGLAFAIPGALVRGTPLEASLKEAMTCMLP